MQYSLQSILLVFIYGIAIHGIFNPAKLADRMDDWNVVHLNPLKTTTAYSYKSSKLCTWGNFHQSNKK